MKLLLLLLFGLALGHEEFFGSVAENEADCRFTVHRDGPEGVEVTGVDLDSELYYLIQCTPRKGYCLRVTNCTVSADDDSVSPYIVIDEGGCSSDTSIFSHVTYLSDFVAGIANPFPIRFRSSSAAVLFYCVTSLEVSDEGRCHRKPCPRDFLQ